MACRRRAVGIARKAAIEVAAVDRRAAGTSHRRRQVGRRHDDQAAVDLRRVELADQVREDDLAFVLVAVVAGAEIERGPGAVADHADRDADPAIGRDVAGIRQLQVRDLLAVLLEVHKAPDARLAQRSSPAWR